ncbi:Prostaglandin F2 receptor negative regulator [Labeo rohita]|uniref:Prostaglandin F2 receptor negative regulator n=1 Tax=Labeo rohita TaxID=84645 RepID=A0ABQ8LD11_LABRO|nr:Prostaglandin F2 receptor negative regulator [Labeo rohita]
MVINQNLPTSWSLKIPQGFRGVYMSQALADRPWSTSKLTSHVRCGPKSGGLKGLSVHLLLVLLQSLLTPLFLLLCYGVTFSQLRHGGHLFCRLCSNQPILHGFVHCPMVYSLALCSTVHGHHFYYSTILACLYSRVQTHHCSIVHRLSHCFIAQAYHCFTTQYYHHVMCHALFCFTGLALHPSSTLPQSWSFRVFCLGVGSHPWEITDSLKVAPAIPKSAVNEGESVDLQCTTTRGFTEHTFLSVTWSIRKGSSPLEEILTFGPDDKIKVGDNYTQRYTDGGLLLDLPGGGFYGLVLRNAKPSDQGGYVCTAQEWVRQGEEGRNWRKILEKSKEMGKVVVTPTGESHLILSSVPCCVSL